MSVRRLHTYVCNSITRRTAKHSSECTFCLEKGSTVTWSMQQMVNGFRNHMNWYTQAAISSLFLKKKLYFLCSLNLKELTPKFLVVSFVICPVRFHNVRSVVYFSFLLTQYSVKKYLNRHNSHSDDKEGNLENAGRYR